MSGSDPALACRRVQRLEVVLQPARSEVRPVGELSGHSWAPHYTAMPCTVLPQHMSDIEVGLPSGSDVLVEEEGREQPEGQ